MQKESTRSTSISYMATRRYGLTMTHPPNICRWRTRHHVKLQVPDGNKSPNYPN